MSSRNQHNPDRGVGDRPIGLWLGVVVAVAGLAASIAAADDLPVIAMDADLSVWQVSAMGGSLTFDPEAAAGKAPSLKLNKTALRQRGITIEAEDVTGPLLIQTGDRKMQIDTGPNEHVVTLDPALVYVDDKADSNDSRNWRRVLDDNADQTVTLNFAAGSKPVVHIIRAKTPSADNDDDTNPPTTGDAPPDPPAIRPSDHNAVALSQHDAMLLRARKAVVPLHIATANAAVKVASSAVLLSEDGFAVTQFHPLRNAPRATAQVAGIDAPVDVQLWSVEPSLDLALIKLPADTYRRSGQLHVLPLSKEGPKTGETVWVLGLSYDGRATVNIGGINSINSHTRLDEKLRRALPFENVSQWVLTSAPVTASDSGAPLINVKGELVAMAVWTWPDSATPQPTQPSSHSRHRRPSQPEPKTYVALSGNHIKAMLERRPTAPVTFARAAGQYALTPVPHMRLPRIELTGSTTPAILRRTANTFSESAVCPMCDGEGKVQLEPPPRDRQAELNAGRDPRQVDAQRTEDEAPVIECPRCKGMGFERPDALLRLGNNIVEALSTTDRAHPLIQREYVNVYLKLKEALKTNPARLAEPLNTEARKHLNRTVPEIGTPILFIGATEKVEALEDHPGRPLLMSLGDAEPRMVVHNTVVYDHNLQGVVFVGGLLAGFITDDKGELVPVIEGGFAVNIPENEADEADNAKLDEQQRRQRQLESARQRYRRWLERQRQRDNWRYNRQRGRTPR